MDVCTAYRLCWISKWCQSTKAYSRSLRQDWYIAFYFLSLCLIESIKRSRRCLIRDVGEERIFDRHVLPEIVVIFEVTQSLSPSPSRSPKFILIDTNVQISDFMQCLQIRIQIAGIGLLLMIVTSTDRCYDTDKCETYNKASWSAYLRVGIQ